MTQQHPEDNDAETTELLQEAEAAVARGEVPDPWDLSHRAMVMRSIIHLNKAEAADKPTNNE